MPKISQYGVCYRLEESPYIEEVHGYRFFFSSLPHLKKFREQFEEKELWLCDSLGRRFKFCMHAEILAVFQLYQQIETRGFHVEAYFGSVWEDPAEVEFKVTVMPNRSQWGE